MPAHVEAAGRLRELARIAGDLGADEMVHDAVALAERSDAPVDLIEAALERFTDRLKFEIEERRTALMRPPALSGSHAAELRTSIGNAQQWLRDLSGEADTSDQRLADERERFLSTIDAIVLPETKSRQTAIEEANDIAQKKLREWAATLIEPAKLMHAEIVERHTRAMETLIERIRGSGLSIEGDIVVDTAFVAPSFDFHTVTPQFRWRRPRVLDEAREVLQSALAVGSQQVIDAFHEVLTLPRRRIEWEIALRLRATADALKRAADAAHDAQREGARGIADELNRLDGLSSRLAKL